MKTTIYKAPHVQEYYKGANLLRNFTRKNLLINLVDIVDESHEMFSYCLVLHAFV
jgi:hypothetical protein